MRSIRILIKCAMLPMLILSSISAYADIIPDSPDLQFTVQAVDGNDLIVSNTGEKFRIFGIIPKAEFLKFASDHLVGNELTCNDAGSTGTKDMFIVEDAVKAIDCPPTGSFIGRNSGSLQEELIRSGVALEYCPESRNLFKTCK